jgi:hypothetical protein
VADEPDLALEDERVTRVRSALSDDALVPVVGHSFVDQTIYLDGRSFRSCHFLRCTFVIRLGWFRLWGVNPMEDCATVLDPPVVHGKGLADSTAERKSPTRTRKAKGSG